MSLPILATSPTMPAAAPWPSFGEPTARSVSEPASRRPSALPPAPPEDPVETTTRPRALSKRRDWPRLVWDSRRPIMAGLALVVAAGAFTAVKGGGQADAAPFHPPAIAASPAAAVAAYPWNDGTAAAASDSGAARASNPPALAAPNRKTDDTVASLADLHLAPAVPPAPAADVAAPVPADNAPATTRIAQLTCGSSQAPEHQMISAAIWRNADRYSAALNGEASRWTGRNNAMVLFDKGNHPDRPIGQDLVQIGFDRPDHQTADPSDPAATAWLTMARADVSRLSLGSCMMRIVSK